jgi:hypothetical protein
MDLDTYYNSLAHRFSSHLIAVIAGTGTAIDIQWGGLAGTSVLLVLRQQHSTLRLLLLLPVICLQFWFNDFTGDNQTTLTGYWCSNYF